MKDKVNIMLILPENVKYIINTLEENGFKAFAVGGCVRDSLLGKTPDDWDITTSAKPENVMALFKKTVPTGIKHGTVTVLIDSIPYEVTTFRTDGKYTDSRHPESVSFAQNIEDDLSRRDFTVNAMAYNEERGLIDIFGGKKDLESKIIRCVGDAKTRFSEDALRMMRAVRFSAQHSFKIEEKTLDAIKIKAHLIKNVSAERIKTELDKILLSPNPDIFLTLFETGLLDCIIPELSACFKTEQHIKYHLFDVGNHTMHVVKNVPPVLHLRYAALFHDLGKPEMKTTDEFGVDHFKGHAEVSVSLADKICTRLKFDNSTKDKVLRLIKHHDREIKIGAKYVKRAVFCVGDDIFCDLINLKIADAKGQNPEFVSERFAVYDELLKIYKEVKEKKEPFSVKNLAINGNDLIALGLSGKEIGKALNDALLYVIDNPKENEKNKLLKFLEKS
ncbi:MAG: CCA tRNA nucleotidyltransferase [Clostridia bacterium]|nr:CCA tRNA nucleotidyltransferase [Clostridia bacterium]